LKPRKDVIKQGRRKKGAGAGLVFIKGSGEGSESRLQGIPLGLPKPGERGKLKARPFRGDVKKQIFTVKQPRGARK